MYKDNNCNCDGWERYGAETIFEASIFKLRQEKFRCLRTNVAKNFYVFNFSDWVNVVALTPKREMVLIKQFRHGSERVELEIPGGGINTGELDPVAAGARELREETGYAGKNGKLIGSVCPNPAIQGNLCHTVFFSDSQLVSEPEMDDTEDIETILLPLDQVWAKVGSNEINHGLVLNALHFYQMMESK